jgi:plastocyanin
MLPEEGIVRNLRALLAIFALALVVSACGGDDAGTTAATTAGTTATTTTATTLAPATTAAPATTGAETTLAPTGDAVEFNVTTNNDAFSLNEITVSAGQLITIIIDDRDQGTDEPHNFHVRAGDLNFFTEIREAPNTQELTFQIDTPGVYQFFCDTHPETMTGVFIVEEDM